MEAATRQFDFAEVLTRMAEERASDVHLSPGFPPAMRMKGKIVPLAEYGKLSAAGHPRHRLRPAQRRPAQALRVRQAARPRLRRPGRRPLPRQLLLPARRDQRRLQAHPARDPGARASSNLPPVLRDFTKKPRGFVLVTGPTGSGKSTTLAVDDRHHQRASARSTSSRSRTRSSSSTATSAASSTSARSGPTRTTSRWR